MTTALVAQPDSAVLDEFIGRMIGDLGATVSAGLVVLGDRLGLYKAMADGEPVTAEQLASRTGTAIAYVRPWLANQAAGGYLGYEPESGTFSLSPEQAAALAIEDSPAFFAGAMQLVLGALRDLEHIEHGFRTGEGFGWHEHDPNLFEGTERFFRPGYATNLVESWLPALNGVIDKLAAGATVVDVGCGHGSSTILMAQAFPASTFVGTDYHEGSIRMARRRAAEAGVSGNVSFEVADASELAPNAYDLVAMFDCLHDMGDPASVARAARGALREDGTLLLVEPFANDRLEENLNPIGRVFYGASTLICTPCSLAQPGARALGPQAGPTVLTNLLRDAGFSRVRWPVNLRSTSSSKPDPNQLTHRKESTDMTTVTSNITSLKDAIESRDAEGVSAWYADNAVLTILDRDNPPAAPTTYRGLEEIGAYYRDICGRNIEHSVEDLVSTDDGLGYTQRCRYPDGTRVVCVTVARLVDGKITRQTAVQVWDASGS